MSDPLVTCLCVTKGRKEWLPKAIECFNSQDYHNRYLLIVPDSLDDLGYVRDGFLGSRISVLYPYGMQKTIGQKRNCGCGESFGEIIATWDDDDFSAPGRLSLQVDELEKTSKSVTGFRTMKFRKALSDNTSEWFSFELARGFVHGTSLCFRREWWLRHRFPSVDIGEDAAFSAEAHEHNQLSEVPDLDLMYATIHAGNTSVKDTTKAGWRQLPGFRWKRVG